MDIPEPNEATLSTPLVRRGRRRSSDDAGGARAEIVAAAGAEFAENGYDATSLRAVARRAGVDAALVHHYFSGKADLFAATVDVPIRPDLLVAEILRGPRDAIGVTIVRTIVTQLDNAPARDAFLALLRTALGHEFAARMLRQFMMREVLGRIARELDAPDSELRASLAASQIVGLIIARYGLRLGALADATPDEVVSRVGPVVQWHLLGE
ncbi:MAG TPA: TetR family transcriptional regulator [Galbitalea sp.]|nr:TetR family transcriptional regulator [Galbitalea sp.]